jgi:8-oxo-dGTP diphosphatase
MISILPFWGRSAAFVSSYFLIRPPDHHPQWFSTFLAVLTKIRTHLNLSLPAMSASKPFSLAVKAVVLDHEGRCLLIRRSSVNRHFAGCWEWPGGKLDPGESFTVGLEREVMEECGLTVELTGLAGAMEFEMPKVRVVLLCMEARVTGGLMRMSEEHDDFAWVPLSDLKNQPLPEQHREFMLDYAKRKMLPP